MSRGHGQVVRDRSNVLETGQMSGTGRLLGTGQIPNDQTFDLSLTTNVCSGQILILGHYLG
jgi:hypothetical protein